MRIKKRRFKVRYHELDRFNVSVPTISLYAEDFTIKLVQGCSIRKKQALSDLLMRHLVTCTGFEPMNACVKGM